MYRRSRIVTLRNIAALTIATALAVVTAMSAPAFAASSSPAPSSPASSSPSVHVPAGTTLRVADQVQQLQSPLQVAGQTNFPFTVEYSNFLGAPAVFQAFQSGDVDFSVVGDSTIIPPQIAGQNFVVVGLYVNNSENFGLISAPGEHVTAINKSQLRGKKIAFQFGTNAQSYVLQLLKKNGLTTSQVDLVNIPSTSYVSALKSGSVNFIVTENPLTPQYLSEISGAKVIYTPGIASGRLWLVADRDAVADPAKSAAIASYLQHLSQALHYVNGHEKEWATAYYEDVEKLPSSIIAPILKTTVPTYTVPITPSVIQQQQELTDLFTQAGVIPQHLDVSKIFTTKYNKDVVADEQS
jgi:sulfonate transport system substrate-binding protein